MPVKSPEAKERARLRENERNRKRRATQKAANVAAAAPAPGKHRAATPVTSPKISDCAQVAALQAEIERLQAEVTRLQAENAVVTERRDLLQSHCDKVARIFTECAGEWVYIQP